MTCGETREYLFAFLDNELDSALSIEVQLHLDTCPECAREAEIERAVWKSLEAGADAQPMAVPSLEEAVNRVCGAGDVEAQPLGSRWFGRIGRIAAAVGLAVGLGLLARLWVSDGTDTHQASRFSEAVVADFAHFLEAGKSVQLASADREDVADWLLDKTSLKVTLPVSHDPKCKLLGGRKCKLEGRTAAFVLYDMRGSLASLVAVPADSVNMDGMKALSHAGRVHWVDEQDGYTVLADRRGDMVYAVVSKLPKEDLYCLMTDSAHESH